MNQSSGEPIAILLVEDNPGDVRLTQEALREAKVRNSLAVVTDGEAAMDYLRGKPPHAGAPRPDLILLDLNLPRMDGREVLEQIKGDENLRRIPVAVLTTSQADEDILRACDLHADCCIAKPVDFPQFLTVIRSIQDFWLTVVKLPPNGKA